MRAVFVVLSEPFSQEEEDRYNDWYDHTHVPALLRLDGFVRASRWRIPEWLPVSQALGERRYLALYELETDDLSGALEQMRQARADGRLGNSLGVLSSEASPITAVFEFLSSHER